MTLFTHYYKFHLLPILKLKNSAFKNWPLFSSFKAISLSFTLTKHKYLEEYIKAIALLFSLTFYTPKILYNKKKNIFIIYVKVLSSKHFYYIFEFLSLYLSTLERLNTLHGPFISNSASILTFELNDLTQLKNIVNIRYDYFGWENPLVISFLKANFTLINIFYIMFLFKITSLTNRLNIYNFIYNESINNT